MLEVLVREQHLRDAQVVTGEQVRVNRHQPRLANCGAGLKFGKFVRALLVAERTHASAHCAAGDEHDFTSSLALFGHLRDELLKLRGIGLLAAVREHARAELDHDAGDVSKQCALHRAQGKREKRETKAQSSNFKAQGNPQFPNLNTATHIRRFGAFGLVLPLNFEL